MVEIGPAKSKGEQTRDLIFETALDLFREKGFDATTMQEIGAFLYKIVMGAALGHTSAMFIGIPTVLAISLVLSPTPKSATGSILRGMSLALLIVAPLVGEGYPCILFASPLFLLASFVCLCDFRIW